MGYMDYTAQVMFTREQMISLLLDGDPVTVKSKNGEIVKIMSLHDTYNWPKIEHNDAYLEAKVYVCVNGKNAWGEIKVSTPDRQNYFCTLTAEIYPKDNLSESE